MSDPRTTPEQREALRAQIESALSWRPLDARYPDGASMRDRSMLASPELLALLDDLRDAEAERDEWERKFKAACRRHDEVSEELRAAHGERDALTQAIAALCQAEEGRDRIVEVAASELGRLKVERDALRVELEECRDFRAERQQVAHALGVSLLRDGDLVGAARRLQDLGDALRAEVERTRRERDAWKAEARAAHREPRGH